MKHRHTYATIAFSTLTLPDYHGWYEGFIAWACTSCGDTVWSTGAFHQTAHAMDPETWQRVADDERRKGSALAKAAEREEKHHVPAHDKYETFARRS